MTSEEEERMGRLKWTDDPRGISTLHYKGLRFVVTQHVRGEPGHYYGAVFGGYLDRGTHSEPGKSLGTDLEKAKRKWVYTVWSDVMDLATKCNAVALDVCERGE